VFDLTMRDTSLFPEHQV
jgi:hypothetical protein